MTGTIVGVLREGLFQQCRIVRERGSDRSWHIYFRLNDQGVGVWHLIAERIIDFETELENEFRNV